MSIQPKNEQHQCNGQLQMLLKQTRGILVIIHYMYNVNVSLYIHTFHNKLYINIVHIDCVNVD